MLLPLICCFHCFFLITNGYKMIFPVVFICSSLMIKDIKHIFAWYLAIFVSLGIHSFNYAHFFVACVFRNCSYIVFKSYSCILDNHFLDTWFAFTFSHSVGCPFSLCGGVLACRSVLFWCSLLLSCVFNAIQEVIAKFSVVNLLCDISYISVCIHV